MKGTRRIITCMACLAVLFATNSIAFAASPESKNVNSNTIVATSEEAAFVDNLYETEAVTRGNYAPSANSVKPMPYLATSDIKNYVFTNYCVKPNSTSLRIQLNGSVNADTPGQARVQILLYNARTGQQVATRNTSVSNSYYYNWTVTQLIKNDPYYVKVQLSTGIGRNI